MYISHTQSWVPFLWNPLPGRQEDWNMEEPQWHFVAILIIMFNKDMKDGNDEDQAKDMNPPKDDTEDDMMSCY